MNLTLNRKSFNSWGIISHLLDENGETIAVTLEHAYETPDGKYQPKLTDGVHKCVLGDHVLGSGPIKTYEITGVEGHSGILFHVGNYNHDSEGCVLVGTAEGPECISGSKAAFVKFLNLQDNVSEFQLTVTT